MAGAYQVKFDVKLCWIVVCEDNPEVAVFRGDQYCCDDFAYLMNGARYMRLEEGKTHMIPGAMMGERLIKE